MSKDLQNIDQLFQNKIEAYNEMPNDKIWQNIDQHLDKKATVYLQKKYTNLKRIAAILLLIVIASGVYINNNKTNNLSQKQQPSTNKDNTNNINTLLNEVTTTQNVVTNKNIQIENAKQYINKNDLINNNEKVTINYNKKRIDNNNYDVSNKILLNNIEKSNNHNKIGINKNNETNVKKIITIENEVSILNAENKTDLTQNNNLSNIDVTISKTKVALVAPTLSQNISTANLNKKLNLKTPKFNTNKIFNLTVFAIPEIAFNRIENEDEHKRPQSNNTLPAGSSPRFEDRHKIKDDELKLNSFVTGLTTQFNVSKNIVLQTGLIYNTQSSYTKEKKVFAEKDDKGEIKYKNNCSFGTTYINPKAGTIIQIGDSAIAAPTVSKLQFIGIPLQVGFTFTKNNFTILPIVGVTYNFLINKQSKAGLASITVKEISSIQGVNNSFVNANFALQLQYKLNKNIALVLSPISKVALSSINKNNNTKSYPNTLGLLTGLQFYF